VLAPKLFKALSQLFHIVEPAVMDYSRHCSGLPPSVDASKLRCLQSRTLAATSQFSGLFGGKLTKSILVETSRQMAAMNLALKSRVESNNP
jgi:hypothetical protein